jgi:hypothetical protein
LVLIKIVVNKLIKNNSKNIEENLNNLSFITLLEKVYLWPLFYLKFIKFSFHEYIFLKNINIGILLKNQQTFIKILMPLKR